jgi:DNA/RNA endonuclease YhcR with UshA esterase domain
VEKIHFMKSFSMTEMISTAAASRAMAFFVKKIIVAMLFAAWCMGGLLAEPAAEAPEKGVVGSVENAEWIKAHLDKEVTVTGVPNAKSNASAAGHFFYNFDRSDLTLFCFKAVAATLPEEKKPASLVGKTIQVTGKLALYKDKPQIVIRKAEQIQIVEAAAATEEKK